MNVFVDFHHQSLFESYILLFKKRFGWNVYRPIGLEWFYNGYWKINGSLDTAKQFLEIASIPSDGTPPLNNDHLERCLTFDAFFNTDINYVIASIPDHIEPFKRLCELHRNKPKFIYQIGNNWEIPSGVDTVLASALVTPKDSVKVMTYHQEFDTAIFRPEDWIYFDSIPLDSKSIVTPPPNIFSFINILHMTQDYGLFIALEEVLKDFTFKSYGGQCRDGNATGPENLAKEMRQARFIWHVKHTGDGYGHILHNAFALGRPVIVKKSYYKGTLGEQLLTDGITCLDIDNLDLNAIAEKIKYWDNELRYRQLCRNVYSRFLEVVDFTREAEEIKTFLEG